jgi:hypothetical protein
MPSWIFSDSSLKQQSVGRHVPPLGHIILIPSQTDFGLTQPRLETTIYHTRGEHANHYATDAVLTYLACTMYTRSD